MFLDSTGHLLTAKWKQEMLIGSKQKAKKNMMLTIEFKELSVTFFSALYPTSYVSCFHFAISKEPARPRNCHRKAAITSR